MCKSITELENNPWICGGSDLVADQVLAHDPDLKTRAAALSAIPDRTAEQLKTAVRNRAQELP